MLAALTIASNGMAVQSQRLEAIAASVAGTGATRSSGDSGAGPSPVRIGALPADGPIENMVSLKEAEMAYRMNAVVFATASDMLETLLDILDSPTDNRR
jgi:flagellar basal-body rod protein FlgC